MARIPRHRPSTCRRPVDQCLGHDVSPLANTSLKRSQLAVLEHPGSLTLQSLKKRFRSRIWFFLQPCQDSGPDTFERIFSRSPMASLGWSLTMGRACFTLFPKPRKLGKKLIEFLFLLIGDFP